MDRRVANLDRLIQQLGNAMSLHQARVNALLAQASGRPDASTIAKLQEVQATFNAQYLQLQAQMQHENRSYTAISNIMKTKHDTAKNSISNVR
jgi:prefoldin subunit 5